MELSWCSACRKAEQLEAKFSWIVQFPSQAVRDYFPLVFLFSSKLRRYRMTIPRIHGYCPFWDGRPFLVSNPTCRGISTAASRKLTVLVSHTGTDKYAPAGNPHSCITGSKCWLKKDHKPGQASFGHPFHPTHAAEEVKRQVLTSTTGFQLSGINTRYPLELHEIRSNEQIPIRKWFSLMLVTLMSNNVDSQIPRRQDLHCREAPEMAG